MTVIDNLPRSRRCAVDHLVVAAPSYPLACEYVADVLGVPPVPAGVHPGRGTRNALLGLGNGCYLEAIGPDRDQPDPALPRAFGIDSLTEPAFVTWALRTGDLVGSIAGSAPVLYSTPRSMSRDLNDGARLEWQLAFPVDPPCRALSGGVVGVPFLIDWGVSTSPGFSLPSSARIRALHVAGPERCIAAIGPIVGAGNSNDAGVVDQHSVEVTLREAASLGLRATIETQDGTRELSS